MIKDEQPMNKVIFGDLLRLRVTLVLSQHVRVEKLQQAFDVEMVLVHFPLHPETPVEGRSMAEVYAGRNVDPEAMYQRMKGLMDAEGAALWPAYPYLQQPAGAGARQMG